jgi:hypothetical protein
MFITTKYSGHNRHGEQSAAGRFLILMQPQWESPKYPHTSNFCRKCGVYRDKHLTMDGTVQPCSEHGIVARLRRITELKPASEMTDEERIATVNEIMADKFEDGCDECTRYKNFIAVCREFQPAYNSYPMRGIVRYVRMRQLGHFMMGSAVIGKHRITLSGSYGSDGLPKTVPDDVYETGVEIPKELHDKWNTGGGWNGAGSEADDMRAWAMDVFFPDPTLKIVRSVLKDRRYAENKRK